MLDGKTGSDAHVGARHHINMSSVSNITDTEADHDTDRRKYHLLDCGVMMPTLLSWKATLIP